MRAEAVELANCVPVPIASAWGADLSKYEPSPVPPLPSHRRWGLLAAAITEWALTTASDVGVEEFRAWAINPLFGFPAESPDWAQVRGIVALYAIFGLPPAILVCFAAGRWAWSWADARKLHTARHALQVGLRTGAVVGLLSLAATVADETLGDGGLDYYHWYPTLPVVKDSSLTPSG